MLAMTFVFPILPGRQEAWRRFHQVLQGSRHCEYEESRQRLGITKELTWFTQTPLGEMAIVYLEAEYPEQVISQLAASDSPFDHWYRQQLLELYDFDVTLSPSGYPNDVIFAWQAS